MAELCAAEEPQTGELSCSAVRKQSSTNDCQLEQACGSAVDVSSVSGARAWLMDYGSSGCWRANDELPFACSCTVDSVITEYGLLAESGASACEPLLDFCNSGRTPTYDGPTICFDDTRLASGDGCLLDQICATSMRLTDDVSLALVEPWGANCTPSEIGPSGSRCYCAGTNELFDFDVAAEPNDETCRTQIRNCTDDVTIVPQGEVDCRPEGQTAGTDFCYAHLACLQDATVDGRQIVARGRMTAYCRQASAGQPWWCSCLSNEDSTIFELGSASSTSWDACTAAGDRCVDSLPVHIGPYTSEYVPQPDPLPPSE
jgi:hypothetical protein